MSAHLLSALGKLEGNNNVLTPYFNRAEMLAFFEEIIARSIETAIISPGKVYKITFDYNQATLWLPGTKYNQCITKYNLSPDDLVTLLLSELKEKYANYEKVMEVDPTQQCVYIHT